MTTNELIVEIASRTNVPVDIVKKIEKELFNVIVENLKKNIKTRVEHFGFFIPFTTKERQGRNMRTGETLIIPAKKKIKFKPSKETKVL